MTDEQFERLTKELKPEKVSPNFEKLKTAFYVFSLAVSFYIGFEIYLFKTEFRETMQLKNAYESASQNVTNRMIGRLEGAGQKELADIFKAYIQDVKIEAKKELNKENF